MRPALELRLEERGGRQLLCSPEVGLFTAALPQGTLLVPGQKAGVLLQLGRAFDLVVPPSARGAVVSVAPERVRAPVGWGELLYELAPLSGVAIEQQAPVARHGEGALVLRAQQSGRFYHRPGPQEGAFVEPGALLEDGTPVGLMEVMKTFSQVAYRAQGGLPARARVLRLAAGDGADVHAGDVLLELEDAG